MASEKVVPIMALGPILAPAGIDFRRLLKKEKENVDTLRTMGAYTGLLP